jgi:hypothetical protein
MRPERDNLPQTRATPRPRWPHWLILPLAALSPLPCAAVKPPTCQKITLTGDVSAGHEWNADLGQGWVFRVLPIHADQPANQPPYSGWDLVVDRDPPAGFPDALLLATPPYDSISEREIGTTFNVRAQDAIGWNPRAFHFLTNPAAFAEAQRLYPGLRQKASAPHATEGLLASAQSASPGQLRIVDAHIVPGIADAAPFAEAWALQSARTTHQVDPAPAGKPTPLGILDWIRFSITLWLPPAWKPPVNLPSVRAVCGQ